MRFNPSKSVSIHNKEYIMRSINRSKKWAMGVAVAAVAGVQFANASAMLEEVIVTAERRSESAQDVPLALTTIGGGNINPAEIADLNDIATRTPNFTVTKFNIGEPQLYLRGIGSTLDSAAADPTVSVFVDEVYVGRPGGSAFELFDLERIEILRGPQGTLYGRNVTGGAVSIYTKRPNTEEFEGKVAATLGDYDLMQLQGYVTGPLSDNVAGKLTLSMLDRGGYAKNNDNGQELDDANNISIRGQLLIDLDDKSELLLSAEYSTDDNNGLCRNSTAFEKGDQNYGGAYIDLQRAAVAAEGVEDPRVCGMKLKQFADRDMHAFSARYQRDMGWASLTSITAYRYGEYAWLQQLGGMDSPPGTISVEDNEGEESDQWSQEIRIANSTDTVDWVLGLYLFEENVDRFANVPILFNLVAPPPYPAFPVPPGTYLDRAWRQDAKSESQAIFGQLTYSLTDSLDLTVGGRYTQDEKTIDQLYLSNLTAGTVAYDLKGLNKDWSKFNSRVSLKWDISDDIMAYATWSEGYKSGVFISQSTAAGGAEGTLEPEDAENREIGIKAQFMDNRVRLNATYFDLEVQNLQLFRLANFTLQSENTNAVVDGYEIDAAFVLGDNLTVTAALSGLDGQYDGGTFDGNDLARAPDSKQTITANYTMPMADGASVDLNLTFIKTSEYFMEALNQDVSRVPDYTTYNAYARYQNAAGDLDVTVWGKNLNDELMIRHSIIGSFGGSVELYHPPRTWGVSLTKSF
jgi:iron complex outermembrane receptor protein